MSLEILRNIAHKAVVFFSFVNTLHATLVKMNTLCQKSHENESIPTLQQ